MWALLAFPKLVLSPNARGGRQHATDVLTEVNRGLYLWRTHQWGLLWDEALASVRPRGQGPVTRGRTSESAVTEATCRQLRGLVGEGAPSRAMQTLLSDGVHEAADPTPLCNNACGTFTRRPHPWELWTPVPWV